MAEFTYFWSELILVVKNSTSNQLHELETLLKHRYQSEGLRTSTHRCHPRFTTDTSPTTIYRRLQLISLVQRKQI
ncbi:hypothetical protein AXX17_AT5G07970 [Arabidopsis thaliana]|jgi:hypothetical protein|uniref:Uncharacterized protein n=1 Tax=Arabidopsis thaliana TaxID=3702 RepID=A0A178UTC2_ARATH|nr:hypothetical protein AXX17_AT5G07970 [Arabidopsis thaliana]